MAREQFVNNAVSYLSSPIDAVETELTVVDSSQFSSGGDFVILIDRELIQVTLVTGSTFTCVRGYESTSAATHSSGAVVALIVTAGSLLRYFRNGILLSGDSAVPVSNRLLDVGGNILTASDFTPINQGDSTLSDYASGGVYLSVPKLTVDEISARVYKKSAPTPSYTLTVQMARWMIYHNDVATAGYVGIGFRESSSGKLFLISMTGLRMMSVTNWTGPVYSSGGPGTLVSQQMWASSSVWFQIEDQGGAGNLIFRYGIDGVYWNQLYSVDRDVFMAGGPDEITLNGVTWKNPVTGLDATQSVVYSTWIEE